MKIYLLSLGAGLLVGVVYSLLQVRSPAPPLVALIGLLGILVGEQIVPVGKQLLNGTAFAAACDKKAVSHVFGQLPGRQAQDKDQS
ncbi:XapX domain-containing protein [Achromobacter xylosoxidans]